MKLAKILLIIGGVINAIFFIFHIWLGCQIHKLTNLDPGFLALMEMLNGGGALTILVFAVTSLFCLTDVLTTRLGKTLLIFAAAFYCLRGLAEFFVTPAFHLMIFIICFATGLLYLAVFILACRNAASARI